MSPTDVVFAWSGGKDSALALHDVQESGRLRVKSLITTLTEGYDRISMHGVRRELLEEQAAAIGLPLSMVFISQGDDNEEYESRMRAEMEAWKKRGVGGVVFADIFLEDLRRWREGNLQSIGLDAFFPLWKIPTPELAARFIGLGFSSVITCVDSEALDQSFAGREYDGALLADLPAGVDPCGENGEFHSFVYDGPVFSRPVRFQKGEVVLRDRRFYFCDLTPC